MEKLIDYFKENHEGKNWTLFLIILGVVHSAWFVEFFHRVSWWQWALQMPKANFEIDKQNPYFIFLEILFIASGITRFLIAIDIFYILANFCLVDDLLKIVWKKRRDEWYKWSVTEPPLKKNARDLLRAIHRSHEKYTTYDTYAAIYDRMIMNEKLPNHIIYWIKLEIKECEKINCKITRQKSFLDKTIINGKKLIKYILSHVQKH